MFYRIRQIRVSVSCVHVYILNFILTCSKSYIIESSVCYLCICDQSYPRKLAFSYLEELAKEFNMSYGNEVEKPGLRPYAFVKFGIYILINHASLTNTTGIQTLLCKRQRESIKTQGLRVIWPN